VPDTPATATPIHLTRQQHVYNILRQEIQAGALLPGTRLTLAELSNRFGVSHIPIREALRQLEQESLVVTSPYAVATVRGVTAEEAEWVAELRLLLEPVAARGATGRIPAGELRAIEKILESMDDVVERNDVEAYAKLNFDFHQSIYRHSPNERLQRMITELWETATRYAQVYRQPGHMDAGHRDHKAILDALKANDPDEVERLVRRHRTRIKSELEQLLSRPPEPAESSDPEASGQGENQ
jgi:DNA-binding GntR family transcriptional regulator